MIGRLQVELSRVAHVERDGFAVWRKIGSFAPDVSGSIRFVDGAHDEVANGWFGVDAILLAFQPAIEPADHMLVFGPRRVFRVSELAIL